MPKSRRRSSRANGLPSLSRLETSAKVSGRRYSSGRRRLVPMASSMGPRHCVNASCWASERSWSWKTSTAYSSMPAWMAAMSSSASGRVRSMPLTSPAKHGPTCRMERGMETLRRGTPRVCLDILPQEGGDENIQAAGAAPRAMPGRFGRDRLVQPRGARAVIACKVPVGAVARDVRHLTSGGTCGGELAGGLTGPEPRAGTTGRCMRASACARASSTDALCLPTNTRQPT